MKANIKNIIFGGILLMILLVTLCIWPFGIKKIKFESKSLEAGAVTLGPITETASILGSFQPQFPHLNAIGMRFTIPNRTENMGYLAFELADESGHLIYAENIPFSDMSNSQYYSFPIDAKLKSDELYRYHITAHNYGENPPSIFAASLPIAAPEHLSIAYHGTEMYNNAPFMILEYDRRASLQLALPYLIISCILSILWISAWRKEVVS